MLTADLLPLRTSRHEGSLGRDHWALRRLPLILIPPLIGALFTANPVLTIFSLLVAAVIPLLLWRPGEPPVLLFCCGLQWLQITTVLHYANFARANLVAAFGGTELQTAVGLGLLGLLALAFGARLGMGKSDQGVTARADAEVLRISVPVAMVLYLGSNAATSFLKILSNSIPQAMQALGTMVTIKWALLFIVCLSSIQQRRHYAMLWSAVALEFCTGLLGYFSGFKSVFFLLIIVMLGTKHFWSAKRVVLSALVCLFLVTSSIVWSAIKEDYREFLNQGSKTQEVLVPIPERIDKLQELVGGLSDEGFFQGVDTLIARVGYVTYFALTIGNVPDHLPYENGRLWLDAVKHVTTPRIFFPGKGIIDDSERTTLYTGVRVAGAEEGTSISIGYMGESYIDFGPFGMFAPIFLLGLLYGYIYRLFVRHAHYKVIGFATATAILLFSANLFETSNVKVLGSVLTASIIMALFLLVAEKPLAAWMGLGLPSKKVGENEAAP